MDLRGAVYEHCTLGTVKLDEADADTLRMILAEVLEINRREVLGLRGQRDRLLEPR